MSESSTNTLGKYQIVREIARSNDIVYEALDPELNRRIALKELCMPANVDGAQKRERIERFWREGRSAGRLTHPNIVTIFDLGKDGDRFYIAMEYLEGQTLRDVIKARGPLPMRDMIDYTLQLCSALSYAHKNGIVHRDIKPENVQLVPGNYVKLTDFGIAKLLGEPSITQDGQVFGTPSYMSPEQVAGKDIDSRSDIFSLGVLMYEMIAGQKPFAGDGVVTITYNIMHMDPPSPPGAPPYMSAIIKKAMAKERDARYSSVDEIIDDIKDERCDTMPLYPDVTGSFSQQYSGASQQSSQQSSPFPQQQTPYGTTYQPSSPPLTPYGTPMPSAGSGASSDPFAMPPSQQQFQYKPAPPIISAETRNFLGIFLLVLGLAGMLAFAIWAVSLAYKSYSTSMTSGSAKNYYNQGIELYNNGDSYAAIKQWENAIRVSPNSQYATQADNGIRQALSTIAQEYDRQGNYQQLQLSANQLINRYKTMPEGYYFMGRYYEIIRRNDNAIPYYSKAAEYGGNDQYAIAARERINNIRGVAPSNNRSLINPDEDIPFLKG